MILNITFVLNIKLYIKIATRSQENNLLGEK